MLSKLYNANKRCYRTVRKLFKLFSSRANSANTISLDLSDYDGVRVICYAATTQLFICSSEVSLGYAGNLIVSGFLGGRASTAYREVTVSPNGLTIANSNYFNDQVNSTSGNYAIPYKIYGQKRLS